MLFLIPTLRAGGAERVMATLMSHFDQTRFEVSLGILDTGGAVFRDRVPPGVAVFDLGAKRARYAFFGIVQLVWKTRPDVVFSFLGYLNVAVAGLRLLFPSAVRVAGRESIVVSRHLEASAGRFFWERAYRWLYPRLDYLVSQSKDMRDDMVSRYGFPAQKIGVIANPVDAEYVRALAGQRCVELENRIAGQLVLVAAGRLVFQKGFDLLIEAIARHGNRSLHLFLLGEGPQLAELMALARALGVDQQISFVGFQKNPYAWFARADAFVLSSRYEGFPNVVIEAMACGTPIIAMPAPGGVRDILGDLPGCELATDISAQGLALAIGKWEMESRGRLHSSVVEPYLATSIVRQYEERILRLAGFEA